MTRSGPAQAAAVLGALAGLALLSPTSPASEGEGAALRAALGPARAGPEELVAARALDVTGGATIRHYAQRVDGVQVHGAEAVILEHPVGAPELIADHTVAGLGPPPAARLGPRAAVRRAQVGTGAEWLRARPRVKLGIDPRSERLAWEVRLPVARPIADLLVFVDAVSGRLIRSLDLLRRFEAHASLFSPNPVVTRGSASGLRDAKDRGSALLASLRVPVVLERLMSPAGCLRGEYVDSRLGPQAKPVCRRSRSWGNVGRARPSFEALMGYFHVDRTRAYVESLALSEGFRERPLRVLANALTEDNSYFSPFEREVVLGTGGVDDGEDGDVIVHEYGHSLQDQQRHLFGTTAAGAAIGEGFGDYLAAALSSLTTEGVERFDICMFEWDAISYADRRCARRTDGAITLRAANRRCRTDPHCVGRAWSGALWELRRRLGVDSEGRSVGDRIVLESQFMYTRRTGFRGAARALLAADRLLYGGANGTAIEAEMVERRFCPKRGC